MSYEAILGVVALVAALPLLAVAGSPVSISITFDTAGEFPMNQDGFGFQRCHRHPLLHAPSSCSYLPFLAEGLSSCCTLMLAGRSVA